jgi:3-oxoacyl-(acyl-carrier-protein) synthase
MLVLRAAVGALQDSGFTIEETQTQVGLVTASKLSGTQIRAQVTVRQLSNQDATTVRATFQRVIPRPGAMLALGEVVNDPFLYKDFFERVSQSLFLTANEM